MKLALVLLAYITAASLYATDSLWPTSPAEPAQLDDAATQVIIDNCLTSSQLLTGENRTKPSREQHQKFHACLKAANIKMQAHGPNKSS